MQKVISGRVAITTDSFSSVWHKSLTCQHLWVVIMEIHRGSGGPTG